MESLKVRSGRSLGNSSEQDNCHTFPCSCKGRVRSTRTDQEHPPEVESSSSNRRPSRDASGPTLCVSERTKGRLSMPQETQVLSGEVGFAFLHTSGIPSLVCKIVCTPAALPIARVRVEGRRHQALELQGMNKVHQKGPGASTSGGESKSSSSKRRASRDTSCPTLGFRTWTKCATFQPLGEE